MLFKNIIAFNIFILIRNYRIQMKGLVRYVKNSHRLSIENIFLINFLKTMSMYYGQCHWTFNKKTIEHYLS
jgi:hypothetical protein